MSILFVFLAALLASSIGFHMYIWFFSVGYGLSIAAIAVVLAAGFHRILTLPALLACLLLVLYGLRLSGYLLFRESRSTAYRHVLNPEIERSKKMPLGAKLALWLSCALLYTLMTSPLYFRLYNGTPADPMLWIGILFMALGILLETVADHQKTLAKKKKQPPLCRYGAVSHRPLPELPGRAPALAGNAAHRNDRPQGTPAVDLCPAGLFTDRLGHVQRRAETRDPPGCELRRRP